MNTYHAFTRFIGLLLIHDDIEASPDVILQPPHINPFGPLGVLDELRSNTPCLTLGSSKKVLFACIFVRETSAIVAPVIVEARTKVVVMEKLGVKGSRLSVCW